MGKRLIMLVFLFGWLQGWTQSPTPGQKNDKKILIRYGTAHVGNGEVIQNAYLAYQGDEVTLLADGNKVRINVLEYDSIIDIEGKHIYPGFILMDSRLGLTEIGAVRATHDFDEVGQFTPMVRALPAFNTESKVVSTVRTNGVLMAQVAPIGGRISGTSACVHFDGWNWKDAEVKDRSGIYLNWPTSYRYQGWWAEPGASKTNKKYDSERRELKRFMDEARAYSEITQQVEVNLRFESMRGLFTGDQALFVRVNWARDILDAIQFFRNSGVERMVVVGGAEAHLVATDLRENNITVVIDRVHKLPVHTDDPLMQPYQIAGQLIDSGLVVAFSTSGDMEAMISRNLPFQVGTAVHYGMPYEEAIKAMTLNPAILMGIDGEYGTIESGKKATFFISDGDALDIGTNKVVSAVIEGKSIQLWNHQIGLYEKYKDR